MKKQDYKKSSLILVGGGGHCKSCIDVIEQEDVYKIEGILDLPEKVGEMVLGYPVIGVDDDVVKFSESIKNFFITLGQVRSPLKRIAIYDLLLKNDVNIPNIRSPYSYVSKHAKIGRGSIIMHGATINAGAKVGNNCIINSHALIEHDTEIGDFCHVSTGAVVNGGCYIGKATFLGSNSVCREDIQVPENSFVRANSLVK